MHDRWLTTGARNVYQFFLDRMAQSNEHSPSLGRTMVIVPHQDDETLGCGGTVLLKRRAGAEVKIVFLTDGRTSHSQFIKSEELVALRKQEAIYACQALGVAEKDVVFLDFQDGELDNSFAPAVEQVAALLAQFQPEEVFMPYQQDNQPDHIATNRIVLEALRCSQQRVVVYEFPIWFWFHWPWVTVRQASSYETKAVVKNTLRAGFGYQLFKNFRHAINVEPVIASKRAALDHHKSQMTRIISDNHWPTLVDYAQGMFLARLFQKREIFRRYPFSGK